MTSLWSGSQISQEDVRIRRNLGTWKGGLFENIVAEALVKAGAELSYYKKDNSTLESAGALSEYPLGRQAGQWQCGF